MSLLKRYLGLARSALRIISREGWGNFRVKFREWLKPPAVAGADIAACDSPGGEGEIPVNSPDAADSCPAEKPADELAGTAAVADTCAADEVPAEIPGTEESGISQQPAGAAAAVSSGGYGFDDEKMLAEWLDFSEADLEASLQQSSLCSGVAPVRSISWFLPYFDNPYGGGVRTVLMFASYYLRSKGVNSRFVIHDSSVYPDKIRGTVSWAFPELADQEFMVISSEHDIEYLAPCDAGVATLWRTAYPLLKFRGSRRKFYFIQDYEPAFYAAGSVYGQAEETYRFGFYGICNTVSLKNIYEQRYGGRAAYFTPCVDTETFYPAAERAGGGPHTVFFYGRPDKWSRRNAFELGAAALRRLKGRLGDEVRICTAGSDWDPAGYGLEGIVDNLGLLDYAETADLYRKCDVGLAMMFTPHPSYIPLELMASGCLVVTNYNEANLWLFRDGHNCLLCHPSRTAICEKIEYILNNVQLRSEIAANALATIRSDHTGWSREMDRVYEYMCDPGQA